MKKDKSKLKSHESTIGKIIYGFLLFLPLFAIGVTCGYAMFNKNAYQSYSGNNTIQTDYINSNNEFELNKTYYFNSRNLGDLSNLGNLGSEYRVYYNDVSVISSNLPDTIDLSTSTSLSFYKVSNTTLNMYFYDESNNRIWSGNTSNYVINIKFNFLSSTLINDLLSETNLFYLIYNLQGHYIDNVFYYSVDKVQESPLFNWAENSIIYSTLTATCTALSINNTFIPLLLAYWLIISVIYIIYDIALVMLMIFHRKVHELQDCI